MIFDISEEFLRERRGIIVDALLAGVWIAGLAIFVLRDDIVLAVLMATLLGSRASVLVSRFRVIRWMDVVRRQDAVIEQLLVVPTEEPQPPGQLEPRNPVKN